MSSRAKSIDDNMKKIEGAAADSGGGSSLSNVAKNKGSRRTRNRVKKERPREAPVSKFQDLIMHGVKPWDSDANDFYESLLKARRELDAWQDQNDSSLSPKEKPLNKFEDSSNSEGKNKNQARKGTTTWVKKEQQPKEKPLNKFEDSSNSEANNKNQAWEGTTSRVKKERPREAPVSKFEDLIMHGVKPWDSDADDFYESLLKARKELDAWQDQNDSSLPPKEKPLNKFQDSSSSEAKNKNKGPKGTTRVKKERPREAPVSKFHDLIMHGVKPWDPDANDFYDSLLEARRELDEWLDKNSSPEEETPLGKFQDSDADDLYESPGEFDPHCQDEGSEIDPCQNFGFDPLLDEHSSLDEDSGICPSHDEDSGINPWQDDYSCHDEDSGISPCQNEVPCHDEDSGIDPSQDEDSGINPYQNEELCHDEDSRIDPNQDEDYGINPYQVEESWHDEDRGISPCQDEDSGIEPGQYEDSGIETGQYGDSGIHLSGIGNSEVDGYQYDESYQVEESCHDEDRGISPCQDEDSGIEPGQYEDSVIEPGQYEDSGIDLSGIGNSEVDGYQYDDTSYGDDYGYDYGYDSYQYEDSDY